MAHVLLLVHTISVINHQTLLDPQICTIMNASVAVGAYGSSHRSSGMLHPFSPELSLEAASPLAAGLPASKPTTFRFMLQLETCPDIHIRLTIQSRHVRPGRSLTGPAVRDHSPGCSSCNIHRTPTLALSTGKADAMKASSEAAGHCKSMLPPLVVR